MQFEVRGLLTNDELRVKIGDIFYGTEGVLAITSYTDWQAYFGPKLEKGPGGSGGGDHFANFVKAVRSPRSQARCNADIEEGHLSSAVLPPGEHRLPARPQAAHQPVDRVVRERRRGRRHAHPRLPRAVRGAEQGLRQWRSHALNRWSRSGTQGATRCSQPVIPDPRRHGFRLRNPWRPEIREAVK